MSLSAAEYAVLVEQAPILVWRAGTDGLCNYFNQRWLDFRGRTLAQEYGNGWAEGVHRDDYDRCLAHYLENFRARRAFEMEYRLQRSDGAYRWIFDRGVPFFDENGTFAGFIGSCVDVEDRIVRQRAERDAQLREIEQLRAILPVCAWCKRIRDDEGAWNDVAHYVALHAGRAVTHGICPQCLESQFPGLDGP